MDQTIIDRVLGQLLRQPEPLRDLALERALQRLMAARSDAPYLLLQRVLALETAAAGAVQPEPDAAATLAARREVDPANVRPAGRSFVRDAAVVGVGVAGAGLLLGGLDVFDGSEGIDEL
jgi:hypothetical protein